MGRKYKVISGDGHVETPPESWVKYMPEEHRERAPRLVKLAKGGEAWLIEGQPLIPNGQNITGRGPVQIEGGSYFNEDGTAAEGAGDAAQRLREQALTASTPRSSSRRSSRLARSRTSGTRTCIAR